MKKFLGIIPFLAITAIVPHAFINGLTFPQSILTIVIGTLCGYQYYLMNKEHPNYLKQFEDKIHAIEKENKELKDKYGKMTLETNRKANVASVFKF